MRPEFKSQYCQKEKEKEENITKGRLPFHRCHIFT
jgi:hypothetical protein